MKILLTGTKGQVGYECARTLATLGQVHCVDFPDFDLSKPDAIRTTVREFKPDLIVNPAAFTAVDQAEEIQDLCHAINGEAPGILAEEAKAINAALIHFSTDYVFDGSNTKPYTEADQPNPINVYGKTKLAGEQAIAAVGCRHLILRTSWVYGNRGQNFMLTMLRLAHERKELNVVSDQTGSPTWCRMLAEVVAQITMRQMPIAEPLFESCSGTYHLTSTGSTNWYEFAKSIFELDPAKSEQTLETLNAITSDKYPTPAKRPAYSVMSTNKIAETFGLRIPSWDESLKQVLS